MQFRQPQSRSLISPVPNRVPCPWGTTLVAALITDEHYEVAWVGDSRVYLWDGELKQLTSDHSYVQELVDQGAITAEQAKTHPHRNVVTQALGVTEPEILRVDTVKGDFTNGDLLLCSDGLTEEVDDEYIAYVMSRNLEPQETVDHLIIAALDNGGSDNVTVVLIQSKDH